MFLSSEKFTRFRRFAYTEEEETFIAAPFERAFTYAVCHFPKRHRECICIHIGQGGIQAGLTVWELLSMEHSLLHNGRVDSSKKDLGTQMDDSAESLPIFFQEKSKDVYTPRAIMVDFDSSILDNVRCGYHNLYDLEMMISGKEDAVNFARGYYSVGPVFLEPTMDQIRKAVNECENLQGIFVFHSLGGGTGSGFGSLIMDYISQEFSKKTRFEYAIYPANKNFTFPSVLEPYNSILASDRNLESFDCSVLLDNQALYNICQKKLAIELPSYSEVNKLIAEVVSATTSPFRFHNTLNVNLTEFQVNLFPFPKAHFPVVGLAPILRHSNVFHEPISVNSITLEGFDSSNQMMECNLAEGKYMACCLLYRGNINPKDINATIDMLKNKKKCLKFIDCCPTGFKVGLNNQPMVVPSYWDFETPVRSVCILSNSTAIAEAWKRINKKFDMMFSKRAFLHWYLSEGMEEQQFIESRSNIESLTMDYEDLQRTSVPTYLEDTEGVQPEPLPVLSIPLTLPITVEKLFFFHCFRRNFIWLNLSVRKSVLFPCLIVSNQNDQIIFRPNDFDFKIANALTNEKINQDLSAHVIRLPFEK